MTRWTQADVDRVKASRLTVTPSGQVFRSTRSILFASGDPRRSKYGNTKTGSYASKREAKRAEELRLLEAAGEISNLREQVTIELIPAQYADGKCVERACKYISDFAYVENGQEVYEDSKGMRQPVFRIKRKMALFLKGIRIRET